MNRTSGVLCPLFSLNGDYGIGQMGKYAIQFIDYLSECGFTHWQILPLNPVDFVKSPYSSPSAFAGYFALIDPEQLFDMKLLNRTEMPLPSRELEDRVSYQIVEQLMQSTLKIAFSNFYKSADNKLLTDYDLFLSQNSKWLNDYALFMALKDHHEGKMWTQWSDQYKFYHQLSREDKFPFMETAEFYKFIQFIFFKQWNKITAYAQDKNIKIIGDMPIYVSYDSADVWSQTHLFQIDEHLNPTAVAGVPPDFFAQDGQLWGFPLYKWEAHQKSNFQWWKARTKHQLEMYDHLRFDHFRAIEAYWSVPGDHHTARYGQWIKAPGKELLEAITGIKENGLIAENLGDISEEVETLRKDFKIPGMKIFQFAYGGHIQDQHLPYNAPDEDIYYSGTHDNDTLHGWLQTLSPHAFEHLCKYYGVTVEQVNIEWLVDRILCGPAKLLILPIQDYWGLTENCRFNSPGTVSDDNWTWRFTKKELNENKSSKLKERLQFFGRTSL